MATKKKPTAEFLSVRVELKIEVKSLEDAFEKCDDIREHLEKELCNLPSEVHCFVTIPRNFSQGEQEIYKFYLNEEITSTVV